MKVRSLDYLKEQILGHKIVKSEGNAIVFDNGLVLSIEETEQDGCAGASGEFKDVVLNMAITNISDIEFDPWETEEEFGCQASVIFLHNTDIICKAFAVAEADNYDYAVASFIVRPVGEEEYMVDFVAADDGE